MKKIYGTNNDDMMNYAYSEVAVKLFGGGSSDALIGSIDHDDFLDGGRGSDVIWGKGGDDKIFGRGGDDTLVGGRGNDYIKGGRGNDWILADRDNGDDSIWGGDGDDVITDYYGRNVIYGEAGHDRIYAGGINDGRNYISGGSGDDSLYLYGGGTIDGGPGHDYIQSKGGSTKAWGGSSMDVFVFVGDLTIMDFNAKDSDRLLLLDSMLDMGEPGEWEITVTSAGTLIEVTAGPDSPYQGVHSVFLDGYTDDLKFSSSADEYVVVA